MDEHYIALLKYCDILSFLTIPFIFSTVSVTEDSLFISAAVKALFGDFDVLPYLTVLASICSVLALVVFTFQYCYCCAKVKSRVEIVSLLLWLVAGQYRLKLFLLLAVYYFYF